MDYDLLRQRDMVRIGNELEDLIKCLEIDSLPLLFQWQDFFKTEINEIMHEEQNRIFFKTH